MWQVTSKWCHKLCIAVNVCVIFLSLHVSLVMNLQLVQGEPCFLPNVIWDRLQLSCSHIWADSNNRLCVRLFSVLHVYFTVIGHSNCLHSTRSLLIFSTLPCGFIQFVFTEIVFSRLPARFSVKLCVYL